MVSPSARSAVEVLGLARVPLFARLSIVALGVGVAVCFAWFVLGVGDELFAGSTGNVVHRVTLLLGAAVAASRALYRRGERLAWALAGSGLALWTCGGLYWTAFLEQDPTPPFPSVADGIWLASYIPIYASIAVLARTRVTTLDRRAWIDGLIAALAVASVATTLVLDQVAGALNGDPVAVAVNLAYPIADTLLLGMVVCVVAAGGRLDRTWACFGLGLLVFAVTDSVYLLQIVHATYEFAAPLEFGWVLGVAIIALAAWQPRGAVARRVERDHGIAFPVALASVSLVLLVVDHFTRAPLYGLALATASLALALVRLVLSHRDHRRNLETTRTQALTDSLTGLGNRLSLTRSLDRACAPAGAETHLLLLFDLDGFKHYNDSFGHPAGDALLRRLGERLGREIAPEGEAYRMGGDEFCVLLPWEPATASLDDIVDRTRAALTEDGDGFRVGASCGHVVLPAEADATSEALRVADRRLYAAKNSGRLSARVQSMRALTGAMSAWDPDLSDHGDDVGELAAQVARRLGLDDDGVEVVTVAAQLHDIGKIAIPRSILQKPGPLDDDEWQFMRRHTLIGERIVQAAPALSFVGRIIRASHERWDGRGYPDGLTGDEIPLAAQIVFACDALAAMTTDRSYRRAMPLDDAIAELRANAGTQFSPRVIDALCGILAAQRVPA